jgi:hypothetical protein
LPDDRGVEHRLGGLEEETVSTAARARTRQHPAPCPADVTGPRPATPPDDDVVDPVLTLLQRHQVALITPRMMGDAGRRLEQALQAARHGRQGDPELLLEQLLTDLGITSALP